MNQYEREITILARELRQDDPTLTEREALDQAKQQMLELYAYALKWNNFAVAMKSVTVTAA